MFVCEEYEFYDGDMDFMEIPDTIPEESKRDKNYRRKMKKLHDKRRRKISDDTHTPMMGWHDNHVCRMKTSNYHGFEKKVANKLTRQSKDVANGSNYKKAMGYYFGF